MRHLTFKKNCEWCGQPFTAQKISTRFCSRSCSSLAYKSKKRQRYMESYADEHPVAKLSENAMDIAAIDVLTPTQAARYLSIGRATLYRYIESGQVKTLKLARKTLIRRIDLDSMFSPTSDRLSFMKKCDRRKENKSQDTDYYTSKQAAEILGLTIAGVHKIFKSNNIRCVIERGIHYYDKKQIDKIKRARDQEAHPEITQWYSTSEIIAKYGMTQTAVYSMAFDFAIPRKKVKNQVFYSKYHVDSVKNHLKSEKYVDMSDDYYSVPEIMAKYKMTRDQVDHYLRYYKISRIRVGKIIKIPCAEFDKLFEISLKKR